ncbi:MAG TPA: hypothetical protein VJN18_26485 [Polyangiaceae bacterium]|nr:hypothetical protein [Polyangiaceae bacterium]
MPLGFLMRPLLNGGTLARPMKKRSGVKRAVAVLGRASLALLSTKQLLTRLARLRFCEESAELSDLTQGEIGLTRGILFKRTQEWRTAYADLKEVLSTREHVSRTTIRKTAPRRSPASRGSNARTSR